MNNSKHFLQISLLFILILTSCTNQLNTASALTASTPVQIDQELTATPEVQPIKDVQVCYLQLLPPSFLDQLTTDQPISNCSKSNTPAQFIVGEENIISHWIYALAAPFFTIDDDMSFTLLKQAWLQGSRSGVMISHLLVDQSTYEIFTSLWGEANPDFVLVQTPDEMKTRIEETPTDWAILPFENIEPIWKIISVDGQSPLRKDFTPRSYPLNIPISLTHTADLDDVSLDNFTSALHIPNTNRDPNKLTTVLLTGVTALVRSTANTMEQRGMTYPADDIRSWFLEADIVHISNEIPFSKKCPQPYPRFSDLVFCSQPEYIELLESISTDVVELSGDHFQDYGAEATLYTIDLYNERGWKYYGGGVNQADGQKPLRLEDHGNKIAFIGCNAKGGGYTGATETSPGAVDCDFDYMTQQIEQLRAEGYLPIVTFQHLEYYSYKAHPILVEDFHRVSDAGAVIVSGSQAHQPHAIELYNGALLHYGLGNLFFDQLYESPETGQAFIDRHVFYDGNYLGTELLTIQFIDLARSRPMTLEERQLLLFTVFQASKK